jgi:hypothetical protein
MSSVQKNIPLYPKAVFIIMAKNKKQQKKSAKSAEMNDWISNLAKEASTSEAAAIPSKEERKRKRAAKKAKRQDQIDAKRPAVDLYKPSQKSTGKRQANLTKLRMRQLHDVLELIRDIHKKKDYIPFQAPAYKKRKTKGWNEDTIQPRPSNYSGIGLARDSLWISFKNPSFFPSLEEEFREHIPGFFGKQRTKAMKRQLDANMLWRKLADKKKTDKKFKGMTPDQRVEAMINSGII